MYKKPSLSWRWLQRLAVNDMFVGLISTRRNELFSCPQYGRQSLALSLSINVNQLNWKHAVSN